ncbi:VAC14 [Mytilus coruscus]|uniref:Protein VAC14 homolog n=1 Tax=Mytilus coruscus TaxID=42192 RepID=A0A6J8CZE7_MYTCO|nr:VAC14 [Mytilus coruscus]
MSDDLYPCFQDDESQAPSRYQVIVKDLVTNSKRSQIKRVLKILGDDFALSNNPNARNGGFIGLAASAIALGKEANNYVEDLIHPVVPSFTDQDSRVRYYACEALYNICKVCRGFVLPYFNEIFDGVSKLIADTEVNVKNGAEVLDRLIKDIVTESSSFDLKAFIPLLRERVYARDPYARQFIVSWVAVLDAVPDINMLVLLPEILDGLFKILGDQKPEIRKMCENVLKDFLNSIDTNPADVKFEGMSNILILNCHSDDEIIQCTAMTWLTVFISKAGRTMLLNAPGIIKTVLPCLTNNSPKVVLDAARKLNSEMKTLICEQDDLPTPLLGSPMDGEIKIKDQPETEKEEITPDKTGGRVIQLDVKNVISVLCHMLENGHFQSKIAVLDWVNHLLQKVPNKTFLNIDILFPALLKCLTDESEEVVLLDLEALAEISSNPAGQITQDLQMAVEKPPRELTPDRKDKKDKEGKKRPSDPRQSAVRKGDNLSKLPKAKLTVEYESKHGLNAYFTKFMVSLLDMFKVDQQSTEPKEREYFIIRQLSHLLNAEDIFQSFSKILVIEEDLDFAKKMVQTLNTILLTSTELFGLRSQLKTLNSQDSCSLFCNLYMSWCHSPIATVSLCFLSQNYSHACQLLQTFGDLEVTVDFLKEIDKLVQLIESPIFAYLRLQLLDVQNNQDLIKSLYGLLMLLPQSEAFKLLRYRLDCIPHYQLALMNDRQKTKLSTDQRPFVSHLNFQDLLQHFKQVQEKHRQKAIAVKPRR